MTQQILEEYLVKLGYKVDEVAQKKMSDGLGTMGKQIYKVGLGVTSMVASVAVATTAFAYHMRSMYFASELNKASVGNMQALAYAGEQVGVSGDAMQSSISALGQVFRLNPGMVQYASALTGISEAGRDTSDVMLDLVKATSKMDEYAGARTMATFGMDADTYHQLRTHFDELVQKQKEYQDQQAALGIDAQKNAKVMTEYANSIDGIKKSISNFGQASASTFLPALQYTSEAAGHLIDDFTAFMGQLSSDKLSDAMLTGNFSGLGGAVKDMLLGSDPRQAPKPNVPGVKLNNKEMFSNLETQYNLPAGLLDSMWLQESGRGKHMVSKAGAMGHFQFMGGTAKQFGLSQTDLFSLPKSAAGAARYMSQLMGHYNGDVSKALAAYNWGQGNVDVKGMGRAPAETLAYAPSILGRLGGDHRGGSSRSMANQTNNITVYSTDKDMGKSVAREVDRTWQDINRNTRAAIS